MYVGEHWSGSNLVRNVQVLLAFVYAAALCALAVLDVRPDQVVELLVLVSVSWAAMLAVLLVRVARSRNRWLAMRIQLATVLLLTTPLPFLAPIDNVYSVILLLVAFVLMVRQLTGGDSFRFAAITVVGVVILSAVGMGVAESSEPTGTIDTFGEALAWAVAEVLRLGTMVEGDPVTHNGRVLGAVVIFSGVLLAAIVFAGVTSWLVGERDHADDAEETFALERAVDRIVRVALAEALGPDAADRLGIASGDPPAAATRVWLDTDRIVGTAPGAWRRDRASAVCGLVAALDRTRPDDLPWSALPLGGSAPRPIAVLQGEAARQCAATDPETRPGAAGAVRVEVEVATSGARALIAERAEGTDLVVTSDARLRARLAEAEVTVIDVETFRGLTAATAPPPTPG